MHYLFDHLLCTKMVYSECHPGTVNTVLTMLGSHPPSWPFSKQSFCASSIFLLMLLNKWLQLAVGENLWNKRMPPEIKPMIIYVGGGKAALHEKDIILLLLTLTFNYIIFLFGWEKCRCVWIQILICSIFLPRNSSVKGKYTEKKSTQDSRFLNSWVTSGKCLLCLDFSICKLGLTGSCSYGRVTITDLGLSWAKLPTHQYLHYHPVCYIFRVTPRILNGYSIKIIHYKINTLEWANILSCF